ncbi:MAG TPA: thioredoxin family protein [Saprospiraceae bacterium]|nr:thioredoxin family protein [Lewinellaceae bacterium]HPQ20619.1 thioredoxin family protein [Saprospiraceae bacterium]HRX28951.1 thioredoxin family protein [Saprospiraceae bacterium]
MKISFPKINFNQKSLMIICILILSNLNSSLRAANFDHIFKNGGLEQAKYQAKSEGKYLFVDFHAKWCTPCKWMEQTTFSNEEISELLSRDYVAVKIDIDDFEGFELKSIYNIRYLPTMLIFNSEGVMVERIEETLTPTKLKAILENYKSNGNHIVKSHTNQAPSTIQKKKNTDDTMLSSESYREYFSRPENSTYRLQMGVFSSFDGAQAKVNALREEFIEPIVVINDKKDGNPIFRVMMGQFESMNEAESFRKILKSDFNLDSIIN